MSRSLGNSSLVCLSLPSANPDHGLFVRKGLESGKEEKYLFNLVTANDECSTGLDYHSPTHQVLPILWPIIIEDTAFWNKK